jgi:hypothetical protein
VGDPADGDGLRAGGAVVGDPTAAGELLAGVDEGLSVCDGLGDRVGRGEVWVGVGAGAVAEGFVADWDAPADVGSGPGRTRM